MFDSVSCLECRDKLLLLMRLFGYMSEINDDAVKTLTKEQLIELIVRHLNRQCGFF